MADFEALFRSFSGMKVAVLGDIMLDRYLWGQVDRISPEAPVPVVTIKGREDRIGGAGNVALNARAFGASVSLFSVTGSDEQADSLLRLIQDAGVDTTRIIRSGERTTTCKTRIISRNQQMMRLDEENTEDITAGEIRQLLKALEQFISEHRPQVLILEDYNKGVLTGEVIREAISLCRQHGVLTAVDPKKDHFFMYREVDLFKPNWKETREALGLSVTALTKDLLDSVHQELHDRLQHGVSLITLSEKGIYFREANHSALLPTHVRNISDVSGAGDTVIAVASMVYALTRDAALMAAVANIAGGLVCEEVGTAAINKDRLLAECRLLLS